MSDELFRSFGWSYTLPVFLGTLGIFVGLAISVYGASPDNHLGRASRFLMSIGAIATVGFAALSFAALGPLWAERAAVEEARDAFILERGVSITDSQMEELDWPFQKPTDDEKFGIAQAEYDGETVSVFLAWEGGEMKLYRLSGQELPPLD